jgi:hypothetical protein
VFPLNAEIALARDTTKGDRSLIFSWMGQLPIHTRFADEARRDDKTRPIVGQ